MKKTSNYFKNVFFCMVFATFSILTIALLVLYLQFSNSAKGYISDTNLRFMKNAAETIQFKIKSSHNTMLSIYTSSAGITLLTPNEVVKNEELSALRTADSFLTYGSNTFSAYIYNDAKGLVYTLGSDTSITTADDFFDQAIFPILANDMPTITTPYLREIPSSKYNNTSIRVLSYFFTDFSHHRSNGGIINLEIESLFDILAAKQSESHLQSNFLVVSTQGELIYSYLYDADLQNTENDILQKALAETTKDTLTLNGNHYFVNKYQDPYTEWTYLSLNLDKSIYDSFQLYSITFIFIIISALVLGLILNFSLSRFLYLPIKNLSHQVSLLSNDAPTNKDELKFLANKFSNAVITINSLSEYKQSTMSLLHSSFLKTALEQASLSQDAFLNGCKDNEMHFKQGDTLQLITIARFQTPEEPDPQLIDYALLNVCYELLSPSYDAKHFFDANHSLVFLCTPKTATPENMRLLLQSIHLTFSTHFSIHLISFLSEETKQIKHLYHSHSLFRIASKRYAFLEQSDIFLENNLQLDTLKTGAYSDLPFSILETKLRNGEEWIVTQYINDYFETLHQYDYTSIFASIGFFAVEFVRMIQRLENSLMQPVQLNYNELYLSLIHAQSLPSVQNRTLHAIHQICAAGEPLRDTALQHIVVKLLDTIHTDYADFNLSNKAMAQEHHISVTTLNRAFKMKTGMSSSEYIKHYRMQKSKELLLQTNLPIELIAQRVGFENTKYYYSLFKNEFGISPALFRMTKQETEKNP